VNLEGLLYNLGARKNFDNRYLFSDEIWVADALRGLGIEVRSVDGALEIFEVDGIEHALASAMAPQALLFDMDGVLVDVSGSYREAILGTARFYGVELTSQDVSAAKRKGGCNNDWELTLRLMEERGKAVDMDEVIDTFEALYQGTPGVPGLRKSEKLLTERAWLERLARKLPLAVVTGRPRKDCFQLLAEHDLTDLFPFCVCMEDGPAKPDPAPVFRALEQLGVKRAWMVGDTVDDVRAARSAGVIPLGLVAPGDDHVRSQAALMGAGAARVLHSLRELDTLL
jgi:HAD superfamily phosphatase